MEIRSTMTFNVADDCDVQKLSDILILAMYEAQIEAERLLKAHNISGVKILKSGATVDRITAQLPDGI